MRETPKIHDTTCNAATHCNTRVNSPGMAAAEVKIHEMILLITEKSKMGNPQGNAKIYSTLEFLSLSQASNKHCSQYLAQLTLMQGQLVFG